MNNNWGIALGLVDAKLREAIEKHPDFYPQPIVPLIEEIGEAAEAIQENDDAAVAAELAQAAAVIMRWLNTFPAETIFAATKYSRKRGCG